MATNNSDESQFESISEYTMSNCDAAKIQATIPQCMNDKLDELAEDSSLSRSNIISEALRDWFAVDSLGRTEEMVDARLVDEVGKTLSKSTRTQDNAVDPVYREVTQQEYRKLDKTNWAKTFYVPKNLEVLFESGAGSKKGAKGYTLYRIFTSFVSSPFSSRSSRIQTKMQLLDMAENRTVDEPTDWIQRRKEGVVLSQENEDVRFFEQVVGDVETVDVNDIDYDSDVTLSVGEFDASEVKQTPSARVPVLLAVIRGRDKSSWTLDDVKEVSSEVFTASDATHENYAETALEYVTQGDRIEVRDDIEEVIDETYQMEMSGIDKREIKDDYRSRYGKSVEEFTKVDTWDLQEVYGDPYNLAIDVYKLLQRLGSVSGRLSPALTDDYHAKVVAQALVDALDDNGWMDEEVDTAWGETVRDAVAAGVADAGLDVEV